MSEKESESKKNKLAIFMNIFGRMISDGWAPSPLLTIASLFAFASIGC